MYVNSLVVLDRRSVDSFLCLVFYFYFIADDPSAESSQQQYVAHSSRFLTVDFQEVGVFKSGVDKSSYFSI
uniref:Uncharacterized protein n=1 Tax=Megaselia scalaris TaxID=36166 RepID=T1GC18_MEGSC